ncbi:MAG: serine/threonine protein kinase, partial [Gammaproteobacteria bacterium]|nr:serine/threonine protein kinase [Gammaproteobacteria bacterium]
MAVDPPSGHPYDALTPDRLLDAIEAAGFRPDGGLFPLNSYENRVYQIGIEDAPPLIAKFYRPARWDDAAILEEHAFACALQEAEIPVVAPLRGPDGSTLYRHAGFRFALFPRQGGRTPDLENPDALEWMGRFLGRIHQLGAARPFAHRPRLDVDGFGRSAARFLLDHEWLPLEHASRYRALSEALLARADEAFAAATGVQWIRLHGDCHPGNILWTESGPHFVDLDDCRSGPAIQDLWMLLSGEREERALQLAYLREGYETFRALDPREVALIE